MATQEVPVEKQVTRWAPEDAHSVGLPSVDSINLLVKVAERVQGSALFPKALSGNPANMIAVMLWGRERGMMPMESLQAAYIVNDRIGMYYDAMIRHMLRDGVQLEWLQDDESGATIRATRPDGYSYTSKWTKEDSLKAGLTGGNHQKYPRNMMRARAVGNLYRIIGVGPRTYTPEELIDIGPEEFTAETIQQQAGTAESKDIDETVIRPEDEADLRKTYGIYGLGPKAATAKLLEIQAEVREKAGGNPDLAQQAIRAEVSRVMAESQAKSVERGKRRRKPSASEQAAEEAPEQAVNGHAQEAAAEPEPAAEEDLGVSPEDVPQAAAAQQGSLGEDW